MPEKNDKSWSRPTWSQSGGWKGRRTMEKISFEPEWKREGVMDGDCLW